MKIIFRFNDEKEVPVEVQGEVQEYYLSLAKADLQQVPDTLEITRLEARMERKHYRAHKYTGFAVSIEEMSANGEQVADRMDWFSQIEYDTNFREALKELTGLQRLCFLEVRFNGRTQAEVAREIGKSRSAVAQAIDGARKKLKKSLDAYDKSISAGAI